MKTLTEAHIAFADLLKSMCATCRDRIGLPPEPQHRDLCLLCGGTEQPVPTPAVQQKESKIGA